MFWLSCPDILASKATRTLPAKVKIYALTMENRLDRQTTYERLRLLFCEAHSVLLNGLQAKELLIHCRDCHLCSHTQPTPDLDGCSDRFTLLSAAMGFYMLMRNAHASSTSDK